jgi:hypothetical protein
MGQMIRRPDDAKELAARASLLRELLRDWERDEVKGA